MTYKILKLVSDYLSGGVYVNRLELGDSGLGGPVDIRFIQYPGRIENTHSVFFGVDGRDAYSPTDTGGLISTSDTGDLVFFDPSNENGRTLTQLYGGGGLWTDTGSYAKLSTPRTIDLQTQSMIGVTEIIGSIFNLSATYGNPIKLKTEAGYTTIEDVSVNAKFAPTQIDLYQHTVMNAKGIFGATTAGGDLNLHSTTDATKGRITLSGILDYSNGVNTHEIWMDGNDLKFKDINYAGGKTLAELVAGGGAGLWEVDGTETQLITADSIDMQSSGGTGHEIVRCGDIELYDAHPTTLISPELHFRTVVDEGFSGFMIDYHSADAELRFRNREVPANLMTLGDLGVLTLYNDLWIPAGYEANFGTPNTAYIKRSSGTPYDLIFYDVHVAAEKTLTQIIDSGLPTSPVHGDTVYYDGAAWARLAPGTNGHFLQTQGAAANPQWAAGGDGMPINPVQGDVIYHNGTDWVRLAAGTNGHFLKTQGAAANPIWAVGGGGVTDHGALTGLADDDHTQYFLANGNRVLNGDLDFDTGLSYAKINFDSNNDYLGYDCSTGNDRFEFKIANVARLTIDTEEIEAYENLNMHGYDITSVDDITMSGAGSIIDMNDGDIRDIDGLRAFDSTGISIRNSGGALKMEIGQTTDSFKVYNNVNMNYHDLEQIAYIDGRDSGNLYIRANSSYNVNLEARGYTLMKWGYLDATHPYHTIQSSDSVPSTGSYYDIGSSTKKFDDLWCVATHVGDCCYAETYCAKCGKDFKIGDNIVHKIVEVCKMSGDMMTIPIHAECSNAPLKKVKLQRRVLEEYYGFDEDSGEVEIKYRKKHTKEVVKKTRLSKNVCVNPENGKCYAAKKKLKDGCNVVGKKYYDATGKQEIEENVMINSYEDEIDLEHVLTTNDEITDAPVFEEIEVKI